MRTENNPRALFAERLNAALYLAHPYRRPIVGWMDDVRRLRLSDAMAFYRQYYTPANAIVVVAGDVEPEEVLKLAEKHYGSLINTAPRAERVRTREPRPLDARRIIMRDARVKAPIIQRMYVAPAYPRAKNGEAHALEVFAQAFGEGPTSLLYRKLVVEERIATWAGAWYDGNNRDYGTIGIYATPAPGVSMEKLEARIDALMAEVLEKGLPEKDVKRAANALVAEATYALDSQFYLARIVGDALTTGGSLEDIREWEARILKVTPKRAVTAARAVMRPENSVTGLLLKADAPASAGGPRKKGSAAAKIRAMEKAE